MEDLQFQRIRPLLVPVVEGDADRVASRAGGDVSEVGIGFRGREGRLIGLTDRYLGALLAGEQIEPIDPAGDDGADRLFELRLGNPWRLAAGAADDEMDACEPAFGKGRVIGRDPAVIDGLR